MNLDITKYLKNKDVKIKNEDFDLEAMGKDLYVGYTKNEDIKPPKDMVPKADYDKLLNDFNEKETSVANLTKELNDSNAKLGRVSLENKLIQKGFKEENFDEVIKLRYGVYGDEKDDQKAIDGIAERFKGTYFADASKPSYTSAPNEPGIANNNTKDNSNGVKPEITRHTAIKDLNIPVTK